MLTLVNALKWLAKFLEKRFPPKVDQSLLATRAELCVWQDIVVKQGDEVRSLKEKIEKLNLYIGLSRPIPTALRRQQNG